MTEATIGGAFVEVRPRVDERGFERDTDRGITGALTRVRGRVGGVAGSLGKAIGIGIGGAAAGAVAGAMGLVVKGFGEIKDREAGIAQIRAGIASTGGVARVTESDIEGLASSLQRTTGQADDTTRAGAGLLLTFTKVRNELGKGNDVFNRATVAASDLAYRGFGSVEGNSKMLGKALQDPIKGIAALSRAGVTFTAKQKATIKSLVDTGRTLEAQKVILGEVETQVGGSGKAFGDTLPGKIERGRRRLEDIAETTAGAVVPAFLNLTDAGIAFAERVAPLVERAVGAVAAGVRVLAAGLSSGAVEGLVDSPILAFLENLGATVRNVFEVIVGGSDAVAGEAQNAFTRIAGVVREFGEVALPVVGRVVTEVARVFRDDFLPAVGAVAGFIGEHVVPVLAAVGAFIGDRVLPVVGRLASAISDGLVRAFDTVSRKIEENRDALGKIGEALRGVADFVVTRVVPVIGPILREAFTVAGVAVGALIDAVGFLVAAFETVAPVVLSLVADAMRGFRLFLAVVLEVFGGIVHAAATAFGWLPGIGDDIKGADKAFRGFKDSTLATLEDLADKADALAAEIGGRIASSLEQSLPKNLIIPVQVAVRTKIQNDDRLYPGRAIFGPVTPGQSYVVGERGPEVFRPDVAGSIDPIGGRAGRMHPDDLRALIAGFEAAAAVMAARPVVATLDGDSVDRGLGRRSDSRLRVGG